jgi:phage-related minor tail protein
MAGVAAASGAAGSTAGGMFAGGFGGVVKKLLPVAAIAAVGKGLYEIGQTFEEMDNTIARGTGATGEQLKVFGDIARDVATQTSANFKDVGTAVADLNTRLGITGEPLEALSVQLLKFAKVNKVDVGNAARVVTRMFGDWSVKTEDQVLAMDKLTYVSQNTGIGVDQLADSVTQFGSPLRMMGFTMEQSLAMFGRFEKEGVNTGTVLAGLKMGLKSFAKAGEEPVDALNRAMEAIKGAGTVAEANAIAFKVFGVRAGPDMAAAIREGRFELSGLVDGMNGAGGTIAKTAEETRTFGSAMAKFKNQILVGLEPIGTTVLEGFTKFAIYLADTVGPVVKDLIDLFVAYVMPVFKKVAEVIGKVFGAFKTEGLTGGLKSIGDAVTKYLPIIWDKLGDLAKAFVEWITPMIGPMIRKLGEITIAIGKWIVGTALPAVVKKLVELAKAFAAWIGPALPGILKELGIVLYKIVAWIITEALPKIATELVKLGWGLLQALGTALAPLGQVILEALGKIGGYITAGLSQLGEWISAPFIDAWNAITGALEWLGGKISEWFKALPGNILGWLGNLGGTLYNAGADLLSGLWDGIKWIWEQVTGWFGKVKDWVLAPFVAAGRWLYDAGAKIIGGIWDGLKAIWATVSGWFGERKGNVLGFFGDAARWLWNTGRDVMQGMMDGLKNLWDTIAGWLGNIGGWIKQKIGDLGSLLWDAGKAVFQGFWNGLKSIWDRVIGWIRDQINKIPSWVRSILGIGSPSKVMADIGKNVMQGLQVGMEKSAGAAVVTAARTAQRVTDAMDISGTYSAGFTGPTAGFGSTTIRIGQITIDGSKMPSADFEGLISSIQTAVRMGG